MEPLTFGLESAAAMWIEIAGPFSQLVSNESIAFESGSLPDESLWMNKAEMTKHAMRERHHVANVVLAPGLE